MKTVDQARWLDFGVGLLFWTIIGSVGGCIVAAIYYFGVWAFIGTGVTCVFLGLVYCTGWILRRIFGWRLHSQYYYDNKRRY